MEEKFINFRLIGKENQYVLYDSIHNIPVAIFFEILKTSNLSLLNPKGKLPAEKNLNSIWNSILENYHKESNFREYRSTLSKLKKIQGLRNKIATCHTALLLLKISPNNSISLDALAKFGYKNKTDEFIEKALLKSNSQLKKLEKDNQKENEAQNVDFWLLVSDVEEAKGFQIDVDKIYLDRWIGMIKQIKVKNERLKKNGRRDKYRSKR